jgi:hypothetical protein
MFSFLLLANVLQYADNEPKEKAFLYGNSELRIKGRVEGKDIMKEITDRDLNRVAFMIANNYATVHEIHDMLISEGWTETSAFYLYVGASMLAKEFLETTRIRLERDRKVTTKIGAVKL